MLQIRNQALEMKLLVGVLGLPDEQMPVAINETVEVGAVVQSGRNQSFVATVRLVINVLAWLVNVIV